MANKREIHEQKILTEYKKHMEELQYIEALKDVGKLQYLYSDKAIGCEMAVLYKMRNYGKVIYMMEKNLFKEKFFVEMYLICLSKQTRYNEVRNFLKNKPFSIGLYAYAYAYIRMIFQENNEEIDIDYDYIDEDDSYYKKDFLRKIIIILVENYEQYQDLCLMEKYGENKKVIKNIRESIVRAFGKIHIIDPCIDKIKKEIENGKQVDSIYIVSLVGQMFGRLDEKRDGLIYDTIEDIIFYLSIVNRVKPEFAMCESLIVYGNKLCDEIDNCNQYVMDYVKQMCMSNIARDENLLDEKKNITDFFVDVVSRKLPNFLKEMQDKKLHNTIYDLISDRAKIVYKSARWQYEMAMMNTSPIDLVPDFIPVLGYLDDVILLPMLVALTIKFVPKDVLERYRKQATGMWKEGKPKKWYYAIPIVLIWVLIIALILKAIM